MRDMSADELYCWYYLGQWPCGHGDQHLRGPSGGLLVNVKCVHCEMKLNICDPQSAVALTKFGQVIEEPVGYKPFVLTRKQRFQKNLNAFVRAWRGWLKRRGFR